MSYAISRREFPRSAQSGKSFESGRPTFNLRGKTRGDSLMNMPASAVSALQRRVDSTTDRAIAERRIVGSVILVAEDGEVVYRRAAGHFDREAGTPIRPDAVFRVAFCTKPIVAAAPLAVIEP